MKVILNQQCELTQKIDYHAHLKRKKICDHNYHKAYAELWEYCAIAIKAKIVVRTKLKSLTTRNPIVLLKGIKEYLACFEESTYEISEIHNATRCFINYEKNEKEDLLEHARRLKFSRDTMTFHDRVTLGLLNFVQE